MEKTLRSQTVVTDPPRNNDWSRANNGGNYAFGYRERMCVANKSDVYNEIGQLLYPYSIYHKANAFELLSVRNGRAYFKLTEEWTSAQQDFEFCPICGRFAAFSRCCGQFEEEDAE